MIFSTIYLSIYPSIYLSIYLSRELGEEEYTDWVTLHNKAENALEKRDKLLMESYNRDCMFKNHTPPYPHINSVKICIIKIYDIVS